MALDKLDHPALQFSFIKVDDIPLFNQDMEDDLPAPVVRLKKDIEASDAIVFVTPEYNRSIPGVLKNIIDWGIRPYGKNSWAGQLMAIVGASPGVLGTAIAQSHLRSIISANGGIVFGKPEVYFSFKKDIMDDEFNITVEDTRKYLQGFLNTFAEEISTFKVDA